MLYISAESILTKPHNFLGLHTSSHHCPDYFNKQLNQNVGSHLYFSLIVYSSQDNENLGWLSFFFVTAFHCVALLGTLINKITSLYHYTYISSFLFYFFFSFFFYINNAKKRSQSWLPKCGEKGCPCPGLRERLDLEDEKEKRAAFCVLAARPGCFGPPSLPMCSSHLANSFLREGEKQEVEKRMTWKATY